MIRIAICDDEQIYLDRVHKMINAMVKNCVIVEYHNGIDLVEDVKYEGVVYDIFVVDIKLRDCDGFDVVKCICSQNEISKIILLTNYDTYLYEGYVYGIFRYINKSDMKEKLSEAISSACDIINRVKDEVYVVKKDIEGMTIRIEYNNIVCIEKCNKSVEFYLTDKSVVVERTTLRDVMENIKSSRFLAVKRGVVVNMDHINKVKGQVIIMDNEKEEYISRDKIKTVKNTMLNYWGENK